MKVYEAVAKALHDAGVTELFGLMGDANMLFVTAYKQQPGSSFVAAVSEGAAVSMADGYTRFRGGPSVATVTHGPGATNAITALTEAVRARTPMLLLCGDTPAAIPGHAQVLDLAKVADLSGARYAVSRRAADCAHDVRKALDLAVRSRTPVLLNLPVDFMLAEVDHTPEHEPVTAVATSTISRDDDAVDAALGALLAARRPVVLAGRGVAAAGAEATVLEFADLLGAALATTLLGQGLFRGHPRLLGVVGTVGHAVAESTMASADCVITFGAALNRHTTDSGSLFDGRRVIQVEVDPVAFGRSGRADIELVGDAKAVAELLVSQLQEALGGQPPAPFAGLEESLATHDPLAALEVPSDTGFVDMRRAVSVLNDILPTPRQVITDCGRFQLPVFRYLDVPEPLTFSHAVHFGSIGLGLATAIGACVRDQTRPTVLIAGDGGAMISLIELQTAARLRVPLIVVILNDGCYGAEYDKLNGYGVDPAGSLLDWPEFAGLAEAMGVHAVTVRSENDFDRVAIDLTAGRFPLLIDVKCDPTVNLRQI